MQDALHLQYFTYHPAAGDNVPMTYKNLGLYNKVANKESSQEPPMRFQQSCPHKKSLQQDRAVAICT